MGVHFERLQLVDQDLIIWNPDLLLLEGKYQRLDCFALALVRCNEALDIPAFLSDGFNQRLAHCVHLGHNLEGVR